jgi:16S rRNA (uracil1498-N3)-methyltransferase
MPELRPPHAPITVAQNLSVDTLVSLDVAAADALRFREINEKEAFTLRDGSGRFFRASLVSLTKIGAKATVYERMNASPESNAHVTLICAVLARQRMIFVAQKATELGVTNIVPVFSAKSVKPEGLEHEKAHAWPGQTLRAAKQCRRGSVPELRRTMPLAKALEETTWKTATHRFLLDDRVGDGHALTAQVQRGAPVDVALAVGPEGGWTDEERALLEAHGARPLRLGGRVLRAETAVVAGLTALQLRFGDMG